MLNFTVGSVMSSKEILAISSSDAPYFRTADFSETSLESERMTPGLLNAPQGSRCVFLITVAESPSNAESAFWCSSQNAQQSIATAYKDYGMWLCPNGGKYADVVFRIGHIGDITESRNAALIDALEHMAHEGLF